MRGIITGNNMTFNRAEYNRNWIKRRRQEFFANKVCSNCNSQENLELDHIDPALKVCHKIWSWNEKRRLNELSKCQVLCKKCHREKTNSYCRIIFEGKPNFKLRTLDETNLFNALYDILANGISRRRAALTHAVGAPALSSVLYGQCRPELLEQVRASVKVAQRSVKPSSPRASRGSGAKFKETADE